MTMVRRLRFENKGNSYQKRCHYCHRPAKELYQARFSEGGPMYMLHPGNCFNASMKNYKDNLEKGTMPNIIKETDDGFSDTMNESIDDNIIKDSL
jgi:hypothetical protein